MYNNQYLDGELIDDCRDYLDDDFDYDEIKKEEIRTIKNSLKLSITDSFVSGVILGSSFLISDHPIIKGTIITISGFSLYKNIVDSHAKVKRYKSIKKTS